MLKALFCLEVKAGWFWIACEVALIVYAIKGCA
jgi:hypothetical protein